MKTNTILRLQERREIITSVSMYYTVFLGQSCVFILFVTKLDVFFRVHLLVRVTSLMCSQTPKSFLALGSRWDRAARAFPVRKTELRAIVIPTRHIPPARLNQCKRIFEKCLQYHPATTSFPNFF